MFVLNLRRFALIAAIVASAALPQVVVAQSAASSDTAVVDDTPALDDNTAVETQVDPAPPRALPSAPLLPPAAPVVSSAETNWVYLHRLQSLRSGWIGIENGVDELAHQQRLGIYIPSLGEMMAHMYPGIIVLHDKALAELSPPPQFAHVHQLHLAAGAEFDLALTSAQRWLIADDQSALLDAQGHFNRFDWLIDQAVRERG